MQTRVWKWLAPAAAAAMLAILLFWPSPAGRAFGMEDVPALLRNARILHLQGWAYDVTTAAPGQPPRRAPYEWWLDLEHGRMRLSQPDRPATPDDAPPLLARTLDGEYLMEEVRTRDLAGEYTMGVRYQKLTPFLARLEVHEFVKTFLVQLFGRADLHEGFQKVGQGVIDGQAFDIWEGETDVGGGHQIRIRSWLAPRTGDLGRVHVWVRMPGPQADWLPAWDVEKIERDVPVPTGLFRTEPPEGYTLHNSKADAPRAQLPVRITNGWPDHTLRLHMAFTLADGSVILGWSCTGEAIPSPDKVYQGLEAGGPLPELPHRITKVETVPPLGEVRYIARHLAFTVREGVYYEWSLHVPVGAVAPRSSFLLYDLGEHERGGWGQTTGGDVKVTSSRDFDTWVRGAMAEFSDSGTAPAGVTWEAVQALAARIRSSAAAQSSATQPAR